MNKKSHQHSHPLPILAHLSIRFLLSSSSVIMYAQTCWLMHTNTHTHTHTCIYLYMYIYSSCDNRSAYSVHDSKSGEFTHVCTQRCFEIKNLVLDLMNLHVCVRVYVQTPVHVSRVINLLLFNSPAGGRIIQPGHNFLKTLPRSPAPSPSNLRGSFL